jgi:uncharacterized Fe-S cluster-containing radical SAM superfamily protein
MSSSVPVADIAMDPRKFRDPRTTAAGKTRAHVSLGALKTLWFNTGTLCNLTCATCYIDSSPTNDRLVYLTTDEVGVYLDEIGHRGLATEEIGFTGGEPFMNPDFIDMLEMALDRGFRVLVLTNAMRPMMKVADRLGPLAARHGDKLVMRVSLDHYSKALHETERGPRTWAPAVEGLVWLARNGFTVNIAGRLKWGDSEAMMRDGYRRLFREHDLAINADDPVSLVLFPEMDEAHDVPEISTGCWDVLGLSPDDMMCASSRMVIKRRGANTPVVASCTLLPYDPAFEMGTTLADAESAVSLNHPHCARFCVLGGGACSKA